MIETAICDPSAKLFFIFVLQVDGDDAWFTALRDGAWECAEIVFNGLFRAYANGATRRAPAETTIDLLRRSVEAFKFADQGFLVLVFRQYRHAADARTRSPERS